MGIASEIVARYESFFLEIEPTFLSWRASPSLAKLAARPGEIVSHSLMFRKRDRTEKRLLNDAVGNKGVRG
jgi:hypothetical protein